MEKNEQNKQEIKKVKLKMKGRTLVIIFVVLILFIASNVFAGVKGYGNIFFMIRDLTKTKETAEMSEILKDRDILISYKSIEIAEGVKVQINELVLKDGEGKLTVRVALDSVDNKNVPKVIKVYDMDNNNKLLGNHNSTKYDNANTYLEEISLKDIKNNTNKLKLEFINKENEEIAVIKVDLANKEVLIGEGKEKEISKLSEVELKQILGEYVVLNGYKDKQYLVNNKTSLTEEQWINGQLIDTCARIIYNKDMEKYSQESKYDVEEINKVIKELVGKEINGYLDIGKDFDGRFVYNKNSNKYEYEPTDDFFHVAKCLEIEKLSFADGVYTVTFSYCYPSDGDWELGTIEDLPVYKTTMKFKLNENYEYTKYCLVDLDQVKSEKVKKYAGNVNVSENNKSDNDNINLNNLKFRRDTGAATGYYIKESKMYTDANNKQILLENETPLYIVPINKQIFTTLVLTKEGNIWKNHSSEEIPYRVDEFEIQLKGFNIIEIVERENISDFDFPYYFLTENKRLIDIGGDDVSNVSEKNKETIDYSKLIGEYTRVPVYETAPATLEIVEASEKSLKFKVSASSIRVSENESIQSALDRGAVNIGGYEGIATKISENQWKSTNTDEMEELGKYEVVLTLNNDNTIQLETKYDEQYGNVYCGKGVTLEGIYKK